MTYSLAGGADQAVFSIAGTSGVLTFTAPPNFEDPADDNTDNVYHVRVTVTNSAHLIDVQDLVVTVTNVDDPPVAVDDPVTVTENSAHNLILVLANDTDEDGGPFGIASVSQPDNGSVLLVNAGTTLAYTPDADYCNDGVTTDDATYTLTPGGSVGTVEISVTCL